MKRCKWCMDLSGLDVVYNPMSSSLCHCLPSTTCHKLLRSAHSISLQSLIELHSYMNSARVLMGSQKMTFKCGFQPYTRNARNAMQAGCVNFYPSFMHATQRMQRTQGKCLRKKLHNAMQRKLRKTRFFANARNRTVFYPRISYASADQWHDCNSSCGIIIINGEDTSSVRRVALSVIKQITTTELLNC